MFCRWRIPMSASLTGYCVIVCDFIVVDKIVEMCGVLDYFHHFGYFPSKSNIVFWSTYGQWISFSACGMHFPFCIGTFWDECAHKSILHVDDVEIVNLQPDYSLRTFTGHSFAVTSLDFHPWKDDLICSCDNNVEIRYWSIKSGRCVGIIKVK